MSRRRVTSILFIAATFSAVLTGCGSDPSSPQTTPVQQEPTSESSNAAAGAASVEITSPQNDDEVPQEQEVTGTAADLPDGHDLWIFTATEKEEGLRYAPQSDVINVRDDGSWTQTAYVGGTDGSSVGEKYTIAVYIVPSPESRTIEAYLEDAAETGKYPGFKPPAGSAEATSVTVVRE